jgi:hypothetical protein
LEVGNADYFEGDLFGDSKLIPGVADWQGVLVDAIKCRTVHRLYGDHDLGQATGVMLELNTWVVAERLRLDGGHGDSWVDIVLAFFYRSELLFPRLTPPSLLLAVKFRRSTAMTYCTTKVRSKSAQ